MSEAWSTESDKLEVLFTEGVLDRAKARLNAGRTRLGNLKAVASGDSRDLTNVREKQLVDYLNNKYDEIYKDLDKLIPKDAPEKGELMDYYQKQFKSNFNTLINRISDNTSPDTDRYQGEKTVPTPPASPPPLPSTSQKYQGAETNMGRR